MCKEKIEILEGLGVSNDRIIPIKATGNLAFFLVLAKQSTIKKGTFTEKFNQAFKDKKYLEIVDYSKKTI